jgi:predicted DNA-binding antitoxin AbrB/MazE fold protein
MSVIALEGVVDNGVVRLRDKIALQNGAKVYVVVPDSIPAPGAHIRSPRLAHPEQAVDFRMDVTEA